MCGMHHRLEGDLGALEVTETATVGGGETTTAATATTSTAITTATASEAATSTATTTAAAESTAATTLTLGLLAGVVQTDSASAAALTNVATVQLSEGSLGILDGAEGDVSESLEVTRLTTKALALIKLANMLKRILTGQWADGRW